MKINRDYRILIDAYTIKGDSKQISLYIEKINEELEIIEKGTNLPYNENWFFNSIVVIINNNNKYYN